MSNKSVTLESKYLRLLKPVLDARGNLYLAKDYAPGELPEAIILKGQITVISEEEVNQNFIDFKPVTNTVPETKVEVQVSSAPKKNYGKKVEVQNLTPFEATEPTS